MKNSTIETKNKSSDGENKLPSIKLPSIFLLVLASFGGLVILMHAGGFSNAITAIMCALASMLVGAVIGFLFGIPKTGHRPDDVHDRTKNKKLGSSEDGNSPAQFPNTNLEDVSDWLTKIIVGVGLIELQNIGLSLKNLAKIVADSMTDVGVTHDHFPFVLALIIFYLMLGFLFGFLTTRLLLAGSFWQADSIALQKKVLKNENKIYEIDNQIRRHTALESVVAQSDYWLREGEKEGAETPKGKKLLDKSMNGYKRAINIDPDNFPAQIGVSKYHAALKHYEEARDELFTLKNKLISLKDNWADEDSYRRTIARIDYNIACYYFLDVKLHPNERVNLVKEAFESLRKATINEQLYKQYAKLDDDWINIVMDEAEKKTFLSIVDL